MSEVLKLALIQTHLHWENPEANLNHFEEKISGILPVASLAETDGQSVVMVTRRGVVKKTPLADYSRPRNGGIIAINLDEGDSLIGSAIVREGEHVMLVTRNGMAIRFDASDTRDTGRNTRGVKGINLVGDDEVVGMVVVDPAGALLTVCANGFGKRTPFGVSTGDDEEDEGAETETPEQATSEDGEETPEPSTLRYRRQRRGGKGVRDIKVEGRNGPVIGIAAVKGDEDLILISANGMVNRSPIGQIRLCGRNTKGVRLINLREGDRVASLAVVAHEEPLPTEETEAPPAPPTA